ncbi:GRAM domain-containing protein 1B [Chelonia mydas]|uniref:GRAM domain-containing protein 1B n=1 Tax=Chelonia mydas TaxID=8469 RepID=M7AWB6_CHEMY|nr:GRAM domain-containing protein 1B [Chelonia mydas]
MVIDCALSPPSTASNSNRSTPACSPILRKRSRSPTPQDSQGDAMVEKGSDHSSDKSPSTPEQCVQRSYSAQSGRSGAKNSKLFVLQAEKYATFLCKADQIDHEWQRSDAQRCQFSGFPQANSGSLAFTDERHPPPWSDSRYQPHSGYADEVLN